MNENINEIVSRLEREETLLFLSKKFALKVLEALFEKGYSYVYPDSFYSCVRELKEPLNIWLDYRYEEDGEKKFIYFDDNEDMLRYENTIHYGFFDSVSAEHDCNVMEEIKQKHNKTPKAIENAGKTISKGIKISGREITQGIENAAKTIQEGLIISAEATLSAGHETKKGSDKVARAIRHHE